MVKKITNSFMTMVTCYYVLGITPLVMCLVYGFVDKKGEVSLLNKGLSYMTILTGLFNRDAIIWTRGLTCSPHMFKRSSPLELS